MCVLNVNITFSPGGFFELNLNQYANRMVFLKVRWLRGGCRVDAMVWGGFPKPTDHSQTVPPPQAMFDTLICLIIWITIMCIMCLNKTISSAPRFPSFMLLLRCWCRRWNCLTNLMNTSCVILRCLHSLTSQFQRKTGFCYSWCEISKGQAFG